ncbi:MAG: D-aminoacyl-tRNA deacylase [Candidatus Thermoplasmatota archaeon]|nr:D-aminoacyl-tRNA deacylase [Candidatus Thermoplasmatota archaeon]
MTTLLIVSGADIASTIQGDALLNRGGWESTGMIEDAEVFAHDVADVHIWWLPGRVLFEDHLDVRFEQGSGIKPEEVIFLSRHFAASGQPSLTLHVIGVPGEAPHGEIAQYGGIKGMVVPPNPRFAAWFRLMCDAGIDHGLTPEFELTIETTHHGPILTTPTMFIEIGSSESHWNRKDAAEAWADVMTIGLGLDSQTFDAKRTGDWWALDEQQRQSAKVMIGIGGGHYAPRHTDVLRKTSCWAGHQLANYALEMERPERDDWNPDTDEYPQGSWEHAIRIAVESTQRVFDGGQIMAHLDRKSFKGWQRRVIKRLLAELEIPVGRTVDFE